MIDEKDLIPGRYILFRTERVMYVGRSMHGGFVVERDLRTLKKDEDRFENVWPFQLQPLQESKK